MPRDLFLRLETIGKNRDGYKVTVETAWFLLQCGWMVTKKGRRHFYLQPPNGQVKSKTIGVKVIAPTDDEIIAVANEMHTIATPSVSPYRMLHGWPVKYWPAHPVSTTITDVDPFTGYRGGSDRHQHHRGAVCRVGFILIWQAEVRWREDGQPVLTKYPRQEISSPEPGLFVAPSVSPDSQGSTFIDEPPTGTYDEGAVERVLVNAYERNPMARQGCIAHYGTRCQICGFDFGERYGEIGTGVRPCPSSETSLTNRCAISD